MSHFLIVALIIVNFTANAQCLCNNKQNILFKKLYNRELKSNETDYYSEISENNFIYVYNDFWETIIKSELENFKLSKHKTQKNTKLEALYNLLQIRADFAQKNYYNGWKTSSKIKSYYKNHHIDSTKQVNYFLWGVYNYFAAKSRESIIYKPTLLGWPNANKELGFSIIKELTSSDCVFVSTEAMYLLGKINLEIEKDTITAKKYFKKLNDNFPNNPIYTELLIKSENKKP